MATYALKIQENVISLKFMEIVFLRYHRDQFIAQDKGDDQSRNGQSPFGIYSNEIKKSLHSIPAVSVPPARLWFPPAH